MVVISIVWVTSFPLLVSTAWYVNFRDMGFGNLKVHPHPTEEQVLWSQEYAFDSDHTH